VTPRPAAAVETPPPDIEPSIDDDELLTLDTGMLSAATKQFSSGLSALKSSMSHAATVWNGQASELLNLPLSATIVEALTVEQIEGWGAKGNVRMLLGVLNTVMPETAPPDSTARLQGHRETALQVILGRGAKSLDALVVSLSLNRSERIVGELDDIVQRPGDPSARGGALAALQILADAGGPFGRMISALIAERRLNPIPGLSPVKIAARERGAAAAVIRVEAMLATHEKERAELLANCQRLSGLADTVIQGPDGPAVRIRHLPTVRAGFEDLSLTYGTRFDQAADGTNLTTDLQRQRRVTALFDSPELQEAMGRLEDLWLTVLQERCAFVGTEATVAVALADRAHFKGLPMHIAATERLALLAQAGADLTGVSAALQREIEDIDRTTSGLPDDSQVGQRLQTNRTAIAACLEDIRTTSDTVLQAIAAHEAAVRTDEAMFRKRVVEIDGLVQSVNGTVASLLDFLSSPHGQGNTSNPAFQARLSQSRTDLVAAIRAFAVIGGAFSRMGGLRMLATVMEGIAAIVEGLDVARPCPSGEGRTAVTAGLARVEGSGMVRQPEIDAVKALLTPVARLDDTLGAAG
jgi:hypothetical protein